MSYFIGNTTAEKNLANALIDNLHDEFQPDRDNVVGDLGVADSTRRAQWKALLEEANTIIQRAANMYSNTPEDFKQQIFPEFGGYVAKLCNY
jgi:hypothetical protein